MYFFKNLRQRPLKCTKISWFYNGNTIWSFRLFSSFSPMPPKLLLITRGYRINVPGRLSISAELSKQNALIRFRKFINFAYFFINYVYEICFWTFEIFQHIFNVLYYLYSKFREKYSQESSLKKFDSAKEVSTQYVYSI